MDKEIKSRIIETQFYENSSIRVASLIVFLCFYISHLNVSSKGEHSLL